MSDYDNNSDNDPTMGRNISNPTDADQDVLVANQRIKPIAIELELQQSYLDYAMSVIVGRALPDVGDGLKPVHRRVLFAMHQLKNDWNKPHKKSARVVGDVIGKYHPHGDTPVYDTIVRMAQDFSMRYLLVDGQGNFGSVDGDSAAAMRYTEIRLTRFAHSLLSDLDKETVDFSANYDGSEKIPEVLPTRVPNLLINGSSGIAVGMATNIPPHNLNEVINGVLALIDHPDSTVEDLMQHIPGPDFPTAALINGRAGITEAYRTGRGKIYLRARATIEEDKHSQKPMIVITELPYQVNKARLLEKMGLLVKAGKIEGIMAIRDESDRQGMRVVIEVRRDINPEVLLNHLFMLTQLQVVFGINMVVLQDNQPKILPLKDILCAFLKHRREVVTRRTIYDLGKARRRAHLLEGLGIALENIDAMITVIKAAPAPAQAKEKLLQRRWPAGMVCRLLSEQVELSRPEDLGEDYGLFGQEYQLSTEQAQAILDLRLHRLTGLEQDKIFEEYREILKNIRNLLAILADPDRLMAVIREELEEVKAEFGDPRRTEILSDRLDLSTEDLIPEESVVVTLSQLGYVKVQALDEYRAQHRGGRGKSATALKDEDDVKRLLIASTHDTILCFSSLGRVYWMKVYELPQISRGSRGKPMNNFLPLTEGEKISAILPLEKEGKHQYLLMVTQKGIVKKTALTHFSHPRVSGVIALDLLGDDRLVSVDFTTGENELMLFSNAGKVIRFHEKTIRPMGRAARGVRGMKLKAGESVIALIIVQPNGMILTATERGYGKRSKLSEYRVASSRGLQGAFAMQMNKEDDKVVAAEQVFPGQDIVLMTDKGVLVRVPVDEISLVGRNRKGVRLMRLGRGELLMGMHAVKREEAMLSEDVDTSAEAAAEARTIAT